MNKNKTIATIITPDYIEMAITLAMSLYDVGAEFEFNILSTGELDVNLQGIKIFTLDDLASKDHRVEFIKKKYSCDPDKLRWSLKPIFLNYLINIKPDHSVMLCDSDMCFFESIDSIFNYLEHGGVVLTPHWRTLNPENSTLNFRLNFMDGIFNAGCILGNKDGLNAINWWAEACLSACEKNRAEGLFDDQRYLDILPTYFPETVICRNPGYNLASWNMHLRYGTPSTKPIVPYIYPISMIHFTSETVRQITSGNDPILYDFYVKYNETKKRAKLLLNSIASQCVYLS